ncbi:uncharacterized protein LOC102478553 [Tupaia chinensis]|uniref:uncharacterized protein LOC102478553 n=1 Tax=Tupaia chinensis TaxID=246437 RepID=UPI000FFCBB81|nr:uncharacterized protein LOC102478553 [Tupaia chinensis]
MRGGGWSPPAREQAAVSQKLPVLWYSQVRVHPSPRATPPSPCNTHPASHLPALQAPTQPAARWLSSELCRPAAGPLTDGRRREVRGGLASRGTEPGHTARPQRASAGPQQAVPRPTTQQAPRTSRTSERGQGLDRGRWAGSVQASEGMGQGHAVTLGPTRLPSRQPCSWHWEPLAEDRVGRSGHSLHGDPARRHPPAADCPGQKAPSHDAMVVTDTEARESVCRGGVQKRAKEMVRSARRGPAGLQPS